VAVSVVAAGIESPRITPAQEPNGLQAAIALQESLIRSIQRAERSVVAIARVRRPKNQADDPAALGPLAVPQLFAEGDSPEHPDFVPNEFGAGVVIEAAGLILTTAHLLGDYQSSDYYVWLKHRPFKATVVAADPWYDLAVLKIDATDLVPVTFGDGKQVKKGQIVIALGNPYSIARDGEVSASWGIVSNLHRRAPRVERAAPDPQGRPTLHHFGTLIQTDARLNIGYSGGALINLQGEMIGLTTSYAARAGFDKAAGFAIPVDENLRRVVKVLSQGRKPEYGFLGVETEQLATDVRRAGQHGAIIRRVFLGTPADRAGLKAGDLITHIDGQQLFVTDDMIRLIAARSPQMPAILSVARGFQNGRTTSHELPAVLTKRYLRIVRPQYGTAPEQTWRGMRVDYSTASPDFALLAATFDSSHSVFVADVAKDSAAWNAGIRAGGYITRVAGEKVDDPSSFHALVADSEADVVLELSSTRGTTLKRTVSP
jgi:serine protease Do